MLLGTLSSSLLGNILFISNGTGVIKTDERAITAGKGINRVRETVWCSYFELKRYHQNKNQINDFYWRNNLPTTKDEADVYLLGFMY